MEQSEYYKSAIGIGIDLDLQVKKCEDALNALEMDGAEAVVDIEQHFAECLSFLAARKASILEELAIKLEEKREQIEATRDILKGSVVGCNELVKSGATLYTVNQSIAETVWQETKKLQSPKIPGGVLVDLPITLLGQIQNHGKVVDSESNTPVVNQADLGTKDNQTSSSVPPVQQAKMKGSMQFVVDNYSQYKTSFQTNTIVSCGKQWSLWVYPQGRGTPHLALFLVSNALSVDFSIEVVNHTISEMSIKKWCKNHHGKKKHAKEEDFQIFMKCTDVLKSGYLKDDKLYVNVEVELAN